MQIDRYQSRCKWEGAPAGNWCKLASTGAKWQVSIQVTSANQPVPLQIEVLGVGNWCELAGAGADNENRHMPAHRGAPRNGGPPDS